MAVARLRGVLGGVRIHWILAAGMVLVGAPTLRATCIGADRLLGEVRVALSEGRVREAERRLSQLSVSHPACGSVALLDAQVHAGRSKPSEAERLFKKACELAPTEPEPFFQFGVFYDRRQQHGRAAEQFRKVLALAPGDPQAYDYLGLSLEGIGDFSGAASAYRMGLARNRGPRFDPMLHYNYGRFLLKQGKLADAKTHLDKAIELVPGVRAVHYERAKLSERLGDFAEARVHAEKALGIEDRSGVILDMQVHYLLSRVYRAVGETALAAKYTALSQEGEVPLAARQRTLR